MTPKFKISIPEPCHEDWSKMTPTEKGRYCKACSKEVIDFTHFSNEALHKRITQGESLCGRFLQHQLDTPLTIERKKNSISFSKIAATLALPLSVISTNISNAQESKPKTEQTINTSKTYTSLGIGMQHRPLKPLTSTLSGTVTDESGLPLPGVNIIVKGTTRGTQTDFDGNYSISALKDEILVFSYLGYETIEMTIKSNTTLLDVILDSDNYQGELIYLGGFNIVEVKSHKIDPEFLEEQRAHRAKLKKARENRVRFMTRKAKERKEARQLKRAKRKEERQKNRDS
ncbi:carboxypeptidase-like regulatory domain-containing protein [Croceibacter atlanticus]|uniref:carboxypeptidase-like regulatory domain-containing protein n=1 Tax=Croceibacter atlanticus TaxID=313588 RepID=UPI0030D70075|tara:strand:- start:9394 stop:10254 length:861 start_codon:yes stop_codon:yes gene_type:complete